MDLGTRGFMAAVTGDNSGMDDASAKTLLRKGAHAVLPDKTGPAPSTAHPSFANSTNLRVDGASVATV